MNRLSSFSFYSSSGSEELPSQQTDSVDFDQQNDAETSALMQAAKNGHTDTVRFLIDQCGAEVNQPDAEGNTAFMLAAQHGYTETVAALLDDVDDINRQNKRGMSALMLAAQHGHTNIIFFLIDQYGTDVDLPD